MLNDKTILVTGGTGSFGTHFTEYILRRGAPRRVIIYSRDEYKQFQMRRRFAAYGEALRFVIGDVRDAARLRQSMQGVDYVVHAAAMKQVPVCEYDPSEAVKTNIHGAMNVIDAALDAGVERVAALSTDKAVNPVNLYGGTKLVSDKLFIAANDPANGGRTRFSVVRYGNVAGSRGSVIPLFRRLAAEGRRELPITDLEMTRFWITLDRAAELVLQALAEGAGGEIFVAKLPSFRLTDLAQAILPGCTLKEVGLRPGEKVHEVLISREDARYTWEYDRHFVIAPSMNWWDSRSLLPGGKPLPRDFVYSSGENPQWLRGEDLRKALEKIE